jgi:hypothetical protein
MALSEVERRALTRVVGRCREMLQDEVRDQLERIYGFTREGVPRPIDGLRLSSVEKGIAEQLREWHRHLAGMAIGTTESQQLAALNRLVEETVFTVLHRLAALRMAEERGVLKPCVRDGLRSDGFRLYLQFAAGALGRDEEAYRIFLERVFDEIAEDLPALFDRREPRSLLFPRPVCLEAVVRDLTSPDLGRAWEDDETIGWIYQDFHSADERREMRRGNDIPRDAMDLAIRNQLFTPRWVVEFLTDNTLGRLWVEMTGGETALTERCAYLLRTEVTSPVSVKDPRDLRVLDPACGSGHFLLYAFDLLETVYLEAWDRHIGESPHRTPVWTEYPDREAFEQAVPALILRHNLFGVDIDFRPIQVAALALWLRAQRSWRGTHFTDRHRIERMNLVCAEPMPGDASQLDAFAATLRPSVLGDLLRDVWRAMRSLGETGLLLRIDDEIRSIVRTARERWNSTNGSAQPTIFDETPNWQGRRHDMRDLAHDEAARFWSEAEERLVEALRAYAAQAGEHDRILRRLFAEDVERGFAFIDLSRGRYDVVLMNPPFGQPAEGTKDALDVAYPNCGHEIYAMFFQRSLELLEPYGRVGAITNRTWLAVKGLRGLRENIFGQRGAVTLGADLGSFVLEALVETSAVIVDRRATLDTTATWVRLLKTRRKGVVLYEALRAAAESHDHPYVFCSVARRFRRLPHGVYAYWMSDTLIERFVASPTIEGAVGEAVVGTQATPDFRFLRLAWEVDSSQIGLDGKWPRFAKGGEYRSFWDDIHLVLNWENSGAEVIAHGRGRPQGFGHFGRPGVTWPNRTTKPFGPRALPEGCAFGHMGPSAFSTDVERTALLLGILAGGPTRLLLTILLAAGDERPGSAAKHYEVGMIKPLPWPQPTEAMALRVRDLTTRATELIRDDQIETDETGETCVAFSIPPVLGTGRQLPFVQPAQLRVEAREDRFAEISDIVAEIDDIVANAYNFTDRDRRLMDEEIEPALSRYPQSQTDPDEDLFRIAYLTKRALPGDLLPGGLDAEVDVRVEHRRGQQHASLRDEEAICRLFEISPRQFAHVRRRLSLLRTEDLRRSAADIVSWAVGVAMGRWDIRLLDHPEWIPRWPDPFGSLPRCPVGQLVDGRGLAATREHVSSEAWLTARTDATPLPAVERTAEGTLVLLDSEGQPVGYAEVTASQYPIGVAWGGLLQDDALDDDAPSRHVDDLYRRVSQVLEYVYATVHAEREGELAEALRVPSLREWIRRPDGFFADHLMRYSKSNRRAPIYWPISTTSGGLTLWLYYPRISAAMLAACVNRLRVGDDALRIEEDRLVTSRRAGTLPSNGQERLDRLGSERVERTALREALRELVDRNFQPHLDDGAVVNAAPLAAWFRNRTWRETTREKWEEIQNGEHDWSHLALWLRGEEVLARCRTERDLAIAHGREELYLPPRTGRTRRSRGRRRPTQLSLRATEGEADA